MPEVEQIAEATPAAATETTAAEDFKPIDLAKLTPKQYEHWQRTGETPEPKKSEAATDEKPAEVKADEADDEPADPASEKKQQPKRKTPADTERRFQELLKERKELKTRLELLEQREAARGKEVKPEPKAEPKSEGTPKFPDFEEFAAKHPDDDAKAWREWQKAVAKHAEDLAEYKAEKVLERERVKQAEEKAKAESKKAVDAWKSALKEASAKYEDFDDVAFSEDVPLTNLMSGYMVRNPKVGAEILYYLGQNPEEAARIAEMDDTEALEEMVLLKQKLTGVGEKKPAAKPVTKAGRTVTELGGTGGPVDEYEAARLSGDFARYERAANERQAKGRR